MHRRGVTTPECGDLASAPSPSVIAFRHWARGRNVEGPRRRPALGAARRADVSPPGVRVYVTNRYSDDMSVIAPPADPAVGGGRHLVSSTIPVGDDPQAVVLTPDGGASRHRPEWHSLRTDAGRTSPTTTPTPCH